MPILYRVILYLRGNTLAIRMQPETKEMTLYINGLDIGTTLCSKRRLIKHVESHRDQLLAHFSEHYGRKLKYIVVE